MRDITQGAVFSQELSDVVWSQPLTAASGVGYGYELDIDNYASGDYIHSGVVTMDGVFNAAHNSVIELKNIVIAEYNCTTLKKFDYDIIILNDYQDLSVAKNNAFAMSTELDVEDIGAYYSFSSTLYKDIDSSHTRGVLNAVNNDIIKQAEGDTNLYGLIIYQGASDDAFPSGTKLKLGLQFISK